MLRIFTWVLKIELRCDKHYLPRSHGSFFPKLWVDFPKPYWLTEVETAIWCPLPFDTWWHRNAGLTWNDWNPRVNFQPDSLFELRIAMKFAGSWVEKSGRTVGKAVGTEERQCCLAMELALWRATSWKGGFCFVLFHLVQPASLTFRMRFMSRPEMLSIEISGHLKYRSVSGDWTSSEQCHGEYEMLIIVCPGDWPDLHHFLT